MVCELRALIKKINESIHHEKIITYFHCRQLAQTFLAGAA
jgi:hypothetical protein